MSYTMVRPYNHSAPRPVLSTELCVLPWETAVPAPLLTLLGLHRQAAIPSNPNPGGKGPNPDVTRLSLRHIRDAMRGLSL